MKTLDEVIKAVEDARVQVETGTSYWVDYRDNDELKTDALHYLQAFRDAKDTLEREKDRYAEAVRNCDKAEVKYTMLCMEYARNDPLDWDELKQMEGKPVWIEHKLFKGWRLVGWQANDHMMNLVGSYSEQLPLFEDDCGKTWQAYRKERE